MLRIALHFQQLGQRTVGLITSAQTRDRTDPVRMIDRHTDCGHPAQAEAEQVDLLDTQRVEHSGDVINEPFELKGPGPVGRRAVPLRFDRDHRPPCGESRHDVIPRGRNGHAAPVEQHDRNAAA
jgi:hypothetical protein